MNKTEKNKNAAAILTFFPSLIVVLFFPAVFMTALNYAGIWCASLLALLPALMAWSGRYRQQLRFSYRVAGGKILLSLVVLAAAIVIVHAIIIDFS